MATTLLLLIASILLSTKATAQSVTPGLVNLIKILKNGEQFTTFIRLLNITQVGSLVNIQLDNSAEMTIFAPSEKAFQNLKPGTLNKLSSDELLKLVLYNIIPKFYTMDDLLSVSNPVRTQASGRDNGVYGLTFTGQTDQIKVSTGYVKTGISNALRQQRPLGVYVVDMVLLPREMFRDHKPSKIAPVPKPSKIAHAPKSSSREFFDKSTKNPAASPSDKSGSSEMFRDHKPSKIAPVPKPSKIAHAPKSSSREFFDKSTKNPAASPSDKSGSSEMFRDHKPSKIAPVPKPSKIAHAPKSSSSEFFDNSTKNPAASPSDKSGSSEMFGENKISPVAYAPKSSSSRSFDDITKKSGSSEKKVGLGFGLGVFTFCLKFLF